MGYVSFLNPKPPVPSTSKLEEEAPSTAAPPPAASSSAPPSTATTATLDDHVADTSLEASLPVPLVLPVPLNGGRSSEKRPRIVSYQSDDSEGEGQTSNGQRAKVARRTLDNGSTNGAPNGKRGEKGKGREDAGAMERLRVERDRLKTTRMELPIWAGALHPASSSERNVNGS